MLFLCVSVYCHRVTTQLQLINIIIIIIIIITCLPLLAYSPQPMNASSVMVVKNSTQNLISILLSRHAF